MKIAIFLTALLLATAANAVDLGRGGLQVLIDFDSFQPGTVIDSQFPEVAFATEPGVEVQTASVPFAPSQPNIICTVPLDDGNTCVTSLFLDFAEPVDLLQFEVVGAKNVGTVAQIKVTQSSNQETVLPIENTEPSGETPIFVDLAQFSEIIAIEIFGISDPAGLGYDNFSFQIQGGRIFADNFESGGTSVWDATVIPPPVNTVILEVLSPPTIEGDYLAGPAEFGMPLDSLGVSGFLDYVNDGDDQSGEGSVRDACQPLIGFTPGKIALIDLGICDFATQVLNAQQAGAAAAVVINVLDDNIFTMPTSTDGPLVSISSLLIGKTVGDLILFELLEFPVEVTLRTDGGGGER